jgi:hypothetical protein
LLHLFCGPGETLARTIAGAGADPVLLEFARSAAQAEFDLAQIRRLRVALIGPISALAAGARFLRSDATGGTLTVSDGHHDTASISLVGNYQNATFSVSSDGADGILVVDPPATHFISEG